MAFLSNLVPAHLTPVEIVKEQAPQLLENMPDDTSPIADVSATDNKVIQLIVTIELIQKAVAWDRRKRILSDKYHVLLKEMAEGNKTLNVNNIQIVRSKIDLLIARGFNPGS